LLWAREEIRHHLLVFLYWALEALFATFEPFLPVLPAGGVAPFGELLKGRQLLPVKLRMAVGALDANDDLGRPVGIG